MVQGVGGAGSSGSMQNLIEYQVYYPMYQQYNKDNDCNLSFESYLTLKGYIKHFNQTVENYLETGDKNISDGKDGNTISDGRRIAGGNTSIYQSEDEESCYEFDYEQGTYNILKGKEEVKKALGVSSDTNVDTIKFGAGNIQIHDYTFGGLDDGQDAQDFGVNGRFGNISLTKQEFDIDYILSALLMDPSDPQYNIAKQIFDDLCASVSQWLPDKEQEALNKIAKESGTDSAEYKGKLEKLLIEYLDQAKEWVEHTHVKNVNGATLTPEPPKVPGEGEDDPNLKPGVIPPYDKNSVLDASGLLADYTSNKTHWGAKHYDNKTCEQSSVDDARRYVEEQLNNVINAMVSQMGEACTPEIKTYMTAAKAAIMGSVAKNHGESNWGGSVLGGILGGALFGGIGLIGGALIGGVNSEGIRNTASTINGVLGCKTFGGGLFSDWGAQAEVKVKNMVDEFLNLFNSLCVNKGKTPAEVEAEKKAAEEKKARETEAFKNLYTMDMKKTAQNAGIDPNKPVQIVNAAGAAEIRSKADAAIITPLKAKIKEQLQGQAIDESTLNTILDNAATAALGDCNEWATTTNNYVYTVDTNKLISIFNENVKTVIKNKGYDF